MYAVVSHPALLPELLPGIRHRTLAGPDDGLSSLEVWSQSIAGHGATPPHRHDCEEVVLVLAGRGLLAMNGTDLPFQAGDTLIIAGCGAPDPQRRRARAAAVRRARHGTGAGGVPGRYADRAAVAAAHRHRSGVRSAAGPGRRGARQRLRRPLAD
ncbi:Auxin binding protein [Methylibium sp. T29-B]|uniref:cupin domain-containing protein n=1 Tax=Methylibium sp. T29-B TaxID=1437443 RepID=UPI0003F46156|nr:cupin domain-containing protein [Methylibium sp. T29-B]EWS57433.1 Auxin binding protein [Methylibium sp. T29-B]